MPGVKGADEQSYPWLRIRTETRDDTIKHLFTLKRSVTSQLDSIEHETEVSDEVELENIIKQLDFVPYSTLTKTRRKSQIDDIELCIDYVEGLGHFMEAEKLTADDADYDAVSKELWGVLEELGVVKTDIITDGYDVLMNKKLGKE